MGCDIHSYAERRRSDGSYEMIDGLSPFDWRSYGVFGFLAGVRNYSAVPPIDWPRGLREAARHRAPEMAARHGEPPDVARRVSDYWLTGR